MGQSEVICEACGERSAAVAVRCQCCGALLRPAIPPPAVDPFADFALDAAPAPAPRDAASGPAGSAARRAQAAPPPGAAGPDLRATPVLPRRPSEPVVSEAASRGSSIAPFVVLAATALLSAAVVVVALIYGHATTRRPATRVAAGAVAASPAVARADTPPLAAPATPAPVAAPTTPTSVSAASTRAADPAPPAVAAATIARPRPPARSRPDAPARAADEDRGPVSVGSFSMVDLGGGPTAPADEASIPVPASAPRSAAAEPAHSSAGDDDAPRFATAGFRKPQLAEAGCVQQSIRLPRGAASPGNLTLKFAVASDGTVGLFEVVGATPERRVTDALWAAVRGCRFVPGADAQGRPTRLWVMLPIRFD